MHNIDDDNILRIKGSEISVFRTAEDHFRIPLVNENESVAYVKNVVVDGIYSFVGLCIEGIGEEIGCVLDMESGILYELVTA